MNPNCKCMDLQTRMDLRTVSSAAIWYKKNRVCNRPMYQDQKDQQLMMSKLHVLHENQSIATNNQLAN